MPTRREQVQAHRFVTRRIVSALLAGEPETPDLPMRRLALAVFGSIMVAAIVFAAVAVYGLLNPGGRRPAEQTLLIERETGSKFLYLQGQLHPVLNYTSARLILGQANPTTRSMSSRSLLDIPRGRPVGIAGAPDTLPDRKALLGLPWGVCSARRSAASVDVATHVVVGQVPPGGAALGERGLLVTTGAAAGTADGLFLIWKDQRLRVRGNATLAALEWAAVQPVTVGEALLNAIPAGPDLAPPAVPDAGRQAGRQVAGRAGTVGQLYRAGGQHYVLLSSGLSPIGDVMSRLLLAAGGRATEISAAEAGQALSPTKLEPAGFPVSVPPLHPAGQPVGMACAGYRGAGERAAPQIGVELYARPDDTLSLAPDQVLPGRQGSDGVVTADRVSVPGGRAALVSSLQETVAGSLYLITDQGLKYPIPRDKADKVLDALGFGGVRPTAVPASNLALVPTAPALDPDVATRFAPAPAAPPVASVASARPAP